MVTDFHVDNFNKNYQPHICCVDIFTCINVQKLDTCNKKIYQNKFSRKYHQHNCNRTWLQKNSFENLNCITANRCWHMHNYCYRKKCQLHSSKIRNCHLQSWGFQLWSIADLSLWIPVNFAKFLRTPFLTEHLLGIAWLLL